jgi:sulfur relay protein TusB/DsrH
MPMLHIISQSLFKSPSACVGLQSLSQNDAMLLIGDGVYNGSHPDFRLANQVFAIAEDCVARGLDQHSHIQYIDYLEMVALTERHNPIITWG